MSSRSSVLVAVFAAIVSAGSTPVAAASCPARQQAEAAFTKCAAAGLEKAKTGGGYGYMQDCLKAHDYRNISCDGSDAAASPSAQSTSKSEVPATPQTNGKKPEKSEPSQETAPEKKESSITEASLMSTLDDECGNATGEALAKILDCGTFYIERDRFKQDIWRNIKNICHSLARNCTDGRRETMSRISEALHCSAIGNPGDTCQ